MARLGTARTDTDTGAGRRPMIRAAVISATVALAAGVLPGSFSGASFSTGSTNPSNTFTTASSFCPTPGTVTLGASRDAFVYQLNASTNYGTASTLEVSPGVIGLLVIRRTLVGFDLSSVSQCTVTAAALRLYATSAASGRTIGVNQLGGSWTEGGVTWNNQPATTGTAATAASGTGWRTWDVTSQVQTMMTGSNHGFLVRDQSETALLNLQAQVYQSREATPDSQDPELVLTVG